MERGTVQNITFYSDCLKEELSLLIYTPANYTPMNQYKLGIVSDGKDYFQLGSLARITDELLDDYEIEELILVGVPYKNAEDRRRKYIPSGDLFEAYMLFLSTELFPYMKAHYAIRDEAQHIALIGDSLAASASLLGVIRFPHLFGRALMHSPFVDDTIMTAVRSFEPTATCYFYHVIGLGEHEVVTQDKQVKDFLTPNRALHTLISEKEIPHFYEEFNGNHTWTYWKPDLRRALVKIFE